MVKVAPAWLEFGSNDFNFEARHWASIRFSKANWERRYGQMSCNTRGYERKLKTLMLVATVALGSVGTAYAQEEETAAAVGLSKADAAKIFTACKTTAAATPSPIRGGTKTTKMWCAVLDREGQTLLIKATDTEEPPGPALKTDAWRASIEIAEAKAYTALSVSSNDHALDSSGYRRRDGREILPASLRGSSTEAVSKDASSSWRLFCLRRYSYWRE